MDDLLAAVPDAAYREAVRLMDAGEVDALRAHLAAHPGLAAQRVRLPGDGYFSHPFLMAWLAQNPVRREGMPANVVDVARAMLDAGAGHEAATQTLGLVASGRVPRESGHQVALIDLLCARGADPDAAMLAAVAHGELEAVDALLRHGGRRRLAVVAALGEADEARALLPDADAPERHLALAFAAQFGHAAIVRLLLDAGEDPDRLNPPGAHVHSTPLHQAVWGGHREVVELLLERGARTDVPDKAYGSTALGWAEVGGRAELAALLRARRPAGSL